MEHHCFMDECTDNVIGVCLCSTHPTFMCLCHQSRHFRLQTIKNHNFLEIIEYENKVILHTSACKLRFNLSEFKKKIVIDAKEMINSIENAIEALLIEIDKIDKKCTHVILQSKGISEKKYKREIDALASLTKSSLQFTIDHWKIEDRNEPSDIIISLLNHFRETCIDPFKIFKLETEIEIKPKKSCKICQIECLLEEMIKLKCEHYYCKNCLCFFLDKHPQHIIQEWILCPACSTFTEIETISFSFPEILDTCDEVINYSSNDRLFNKPIQNKIASTNPSPESKSPNGVCNKCDALWNPILEHGNHYHKQNCPDFSNYTGFDRYIPGKCSECKKLNMLCPRPAQ